MFYIAYSIINYEDKYIVICHSGGCHSCSILESIFHSQEDAEKYVNEQLDLCKEHLTKSREELIYTSKIDSYEELKQLLSYVGDEKNLRYFSKRKRNEIRRHIDSLL